MGLFNFLFGRTRKPTPDEWALDQFKRLGEDLSQPHGLEFRLYFPTASEADQAATRIKAAGFDVGETLRNQEGWLCLATRTMVPELAALSQIHGDLDSIAAQFGGRYDGWGMAEESQK
ncbi:MAG TPA: ribonuclease E inhibitor RraB [Candidatus Sulfotelmatobacter sp.]|nr:ribonuclease E inhibitor RraB [Candidatus Sulfotelmatobacter sp.]